MTKRRGTSSDNGFIYKKIKINENRNRKKHPVSENGGLHKQGMANPANQQISEKLHFLTHAFTFEFFFEPNDFI